MTVGGLKRRVFTIVLLRPRCHSRPHFKRGPCWRRQRPGATVCRVKDLTLSVVGIVVLALGIGLAFHWLYPRVELSAELAGLFALVAVVLRLLIGKGWALLRKPPPPSETEARK